MSYRFPLSMNKWYVTVNAKFQFWHLERPWQQWQWTGMKYSFQFLYLDPSWTLCEEKNHKAHIRNPLLSMQSIACHFINWALYPSESIHVNSKLSQRMARLQMVKCHRLSQYTCKYNSIYAYKKSTAFHAPSSTKQTSIMYRPLILSFRPGEKCMWKVDRNSVKYFLCSWYRASLKCIPLSITNKMLSYTIFFIAVDAVHVSGGFSTHHQELKLYTQHLVYVKLACCYR